MDAMNLDDATVDPAEMRAIADELLGARWAAGTLAGVRTARLLAAYARGKARAMEARLAGRIPDALAEEARLERIYRLLPEAARW